MEPTNRPMKTRRSGMLIIQCTRSNRNLVRERHLHCRSSRSSRAPAPLFFGTRERQQRITSGVHLAGGDDDDDLEAESQDRRSGCRRCREHGYTERGVDQEGHEAEVCPEALRAVRARGEEALGVQGVQRLSARSSSALSLQGVRWVWNLRARPSSLSMQGVRWVWNLRARPSALSMQGVRRGINLRARS